MCCIDTNLQSWADMLCFTEGVQLGVQAATEEVAQRELRHVRPLDFAEVAYQVKPRTCDAPSPLRTHPRPVKQRRLNMCT